MPTKIVKLSGHGEIEIAYDETTVWIEDWTDASHRQLITLYVSDLPALIAALREIIEGGASNQTSKIF